MTVYARTATGDTAPLRILTGEATGLSGPQFLVMTTSGLPTASVALNESAFRTGQQLTYQATLTPGSTPTQVDIYLGCLLPDFATFLSLVQSAPGVISTVLGPSPTPFLANVTLAQTVVQFPYTFAGFEPAGTYFPYAGLTAAGSNPILPANQLSLGVQPFQFSP